MLFCLLYTHCSFDLFLIIHPSLNILLCILITSGRHRTSFRSEAASSAWNAAKRQPAVSSCGVRWTYSTASRWKRRSVVLRTWKGKHLPVTLSPIDFISAIMFWLSQNPQFSYNRYTYKTCLYLYECIYLWWWYQIQGVPKRRTP